jgi:hypothetical protein
MGESSPSSAKAPCSDPSDVTRFEKNSSFLSRLRSDLNCDGLESDLPVGIRSLGIVSPALSFLKGSGRYI